MVTSFAITHTTLHTGDADGTILEDRTVVVGADGCLAAVGPADSVDPPAGMLRIDERGKHLLPGLINAHANLFADGSPLAGFLTNPRIMKVTTKVLRSPSAARSCCAAPGRTH